MRVNLRHGEQYQMSEVYQHQKEEIKSKNVTRDVHSLWDAMDQVHPFSVPCSPFLFNREWKDRQGNIAVHPGDTIELRFTTHDPVSAEVPVQTTSSDRLHKLLRNLQDS